RTTTDSATVSSAGCLTVQATMGDREVDMDTATPPIVDTAKDTVFLGLDAGLKTGDQVQYDAEGNTAIGGLTSLNSYFVNVQDNGTVKLYDTKDHAKDGGSTGLVNLTSGATGTEHKFNKYISVSGTDVPNPLDNVKFNPTGTVRVLDLGGDTGLRTGDAVKYDAHGGSAIGGLTSGNTYYVVELGDGKFQLAASVKDAHAGKAILLTSAGNDNQKLVDQTDSFITQATSGGGGGK